MHGHDREKILPRVCLCIFCCDVRLSTSDRPSVRPSVHCRRCVPRNSGAGRKEGEEGGGIKGGEEGLPSPTGTPPPPPPTPIGRPAPTDGRAKEASFLASSRMERGKGGLRTLSLSTASYLLLLLLPACSLFSGRPRSQGTPPPPPLMPPLRSKGQQRRRQLRSLFSPSSEGRERSGCCGRALLFPSRRQVDLLLRPFVADRPYGRRAERRAGGRTALLVRYVRNREGLSKLQVSLERRRRAVVEGRGD